MLFCFDFIFIYVEYVQVFYFVLIGEWENVIVIQNEKDKLRSIVHTAKFILAYCERFHSF